MAEAEQLEAIKALKQKTMAHDTVRKSAQLKKDSLNKWNQLNNSKSKQPPGAQAAAQRFKGKYAGPDKYKGKIPEGYKGKAKGEYFGKDSRKGANVPAKSVTKYTPNDPNTGTAYKFKGAKPAATFIKKYRTLKSS